MASVVTKTVLGRRYVYYSYYNNGKKKEKYCGVESESSTERKIVLTQIEHIHDQRKSLLQESKLLEKKLKRL